MANTHDNGMEFFQSSSSTFADNLASFLHPAPPLPLPSPFSSKNDQISGGNTDVKIALQPRRPSLGEPERVLRINSLNQSNYHSTHSQQRQWEHQDKL